MKNSTSHPKSKILNYIIIGIFFEGFFMLIKTCFYVKIGENLIFRHSLFPRRVLQIDVLQVTEHGIAK